MDAAAATMCVNEDGAVNYCANLLHNNWIMMDDTLTMTLTVSEGTLSSGSATVTSGSGTSTLTMVGTPAVLNGAVLFDFISYQPDANFSGADTLTVSVTDGDSAPVTDTTAITVNPVADTPTGAANNVITNIDVPVALDITAALTDPGETLEVRLLNVATGSLINGNPAPFTFSAAELAGGLTLTPPAGSDTDFTVTVEIAAIESDASESVVTDTFLFEIIDGPNDAPTIDAPAAITVDEDVSTALTGLIIADNDDDTLTMTLSVTNGTISSNNAAVNSRKCYWNTHNGWNACRIKCSDYRK